MERRGLAWVRPAIARLVAIVTAAGLCGGCFQPLYGDQSAPDGSTVRQALSGIVVEQVAAPPNTVEARLAVQIRNELIFSFTGGGHAPPPTHRLAIQISGGRATVSAGNNHIPIIENYGLSATYALVELGTGRQVARGAVSTIASYDPSGTQRFARLSGLQDAGNRTAKVLADAITTRLASYFVSGQ